MNRTEAKEHLLTFIVHYPNTFIDLDFEHRLKSDAQGRKTLRALHVLTGLADFDNILAVYETYILEELIALEHDYWMCQCDNDYIHLRAHTKRCPVCKYNFSYLPSPTTEEVKNMKLVIK